MKKRLLLSLGAVALATAFTASAVDILDVDFSSYPDGPITNNVGWVSAGGNSVVGGELVLTSDASDVMYDTGIPVEFGDRIRITMDHTIAANLFNNRAHEGLYQWGIQTNGVEAVGIADNRIYNYFFLWGQELSREDGYVSIMPSGNSWDVNSIQLDSLEELGFNPFGYDSNLAADVESEVIPETVDLQTTYTITKSHVSGLFNIELTHSNTLAGTSTTTLMDIEKPDVWAATSYYFYMDGNARTDITNSMKSVKVEWLDPVVSVPTGVSALGLDGEVSLSWDVMPGSTTYNVYRTEIPGDYSGVTPFVATTESYTDAGVVNGTTYYYSVEAIYSSGTSTKSAEAEATPQSIYSDGLVLVDDFTGYSDGDLATISADWNGNSGGGSNAFTVVDIDDSATTTLTEADFDSTNGNGVVMSKLIKNDVDDVVEGYIDVVVSATAQPGEDADYGHRTIMTWGLTSTDATAADVSSDDMALFSLNCRVENRLNVQFGIANPTGNAESLSVLSWDATTGVGWNPRPNGGGWGGDATLGQDLDTEKLRISWKIRKTREEGVYQAWASVSNLTTSVVMNGEVEWSTRERQGMYDSPAAAFSMTHDRNSWDPAKPDRLHATVSEVSISHTSGVKPVVETPVLAEPLRGDRAVTLSWDPILECTGFTVEMTDPDNVTYVLASMTQDTTITDSPRWNDIENSYKVTAHFDSDLVPDETSAEVSAAPIGLKPVWHSEEADWLDGSDVAFNVASNYVISGDIYLDQRTTPFFTEGEGSYRGPTMYGIVQGPTGLVDGGNPVPDENLLAVNVKGNPGSIAFGGSGNIWSFPPFRRMLGYVEVSDFNFESQTFFDATTGALYIKVRTGPGGWTNSNVGDLYTAIRNNDQWYVCATPTAIIGGNGAAATERITLTPDVLQSGWLELDTSNPALPLTPGAALDDTSSLNNITAIGFFVKDVFSADVTEFEVKVSGALASYDYWADNAGLVSSNSAPELDPDLDGIINKHEFAHGGDPLVQDTAILPTAEVLGAAGSESIQYVYRMQRDPVSGIDYVLKTTTDLVNGDGNSNDGVWSTNNHTSAETVEDYYWMNVTNEVPFGTGIGETFIDLDIQ